MDGIQLEILWSNLISIVSEQARALQRIAFSPVVRDAGDLAVGMFDAEGAWSPRPSLEPPATSTAWPPRRATFWRSTRPKSWSTATS